MEHGVGEQGAVDVETDEAVQAIRQIIAAEFLDRIVAVVQRPTLSGFHVQQIGGLIAEIKIIVGHHEGPFVIDDLRIV